MKISDMPSLLELPALLKEKVDVLEKTLLAITSVNDINLQDMKSGNLGANWESTANLLDHLLEPAMYQVEELRNMIYDLQLKERKNS